MRINPKYTPFFIGFTLALGIIIGSYLQASQQLYFISNNDSKAKLNTLVDFIDNHYVDHVNTDSIVGTTVDNIMNQLDPHSVYVSPQDQKEVQESLQGNFVGIGINYYMYKDTLTVIRPIENGPSEKAGLKAGDRILYFFKAQRARRFASKFDHFAKSRA
jgi:carboxyl-terminal processing protease